MKILSRIFSLKFTNKKGRLIVRFLPFFALIASCSVDLSQYGRVAPQNTAHKNSFVFSVSEEYLDKNQDSKQDEKYPKMTKAESALLVKILKQQKYCLNKDSKIAFQITSRQEKIYDATFSHLIEQNYRAKPVAPRMYYGECL